jgi:hypothetical protein
MPAKHWAHDALKRMIVWSRMRNPKARAYVEPWPNKIDTWFRQPQTSHLAGMGIWIMATNDYMLSELLGRPLPDWPLLPLGPEHEVIVHITGNPYPDIGVPIEKWMPALIQHHVNRGRSIAVPPSNLRTIGMKPADFGVTS